ncbi:MAG: S-layer homology domain-containing protein [Clostridia bacterium]|nr:S-layer homology domain-containing protein [Clostridia bacterium]
MINIKKIVSLLMSVLLVAASIAAPSFAADGDSARLMPGTTSIADHVNGTYAYMEAADTLSGTALRIAGSKLSNFNYATGYIKYSTPQDWSHYNYLNMVIKNVTSAQGQVLAFLDLSDRNAITDATGTMYYKSFKPTGTDWNLISFPLDNFTGIGSPTGRNAIRGFCFAQNLSADVYLDAVWLSEEQVTPTAQLSASVPDGFDEVIADSAEFVFTYSNDLAPQDKQNAEISFTDDSGAPVECEAIYSGNTLTIEPINGLEFGESYSLSISGVRDCYGLKLAKTTTNFSTLQRGMTASKPILCNDRGVEFTELPFDGTITAKANAHNISADSASATLVIASYDADGKMIASEMATDSIELAPSQSGELTAAIESDDYTGKTVRAFVVDSLSSRNILTTDYPTLPAEAPAEPGEVKEGPTDELTQVSFDFADDVASVEATLNGGMDRTLLMSVFKGSELIHISPLHNTADGKVSASYKMTEADATGKYTFELKGRNIKNTLTNVYTHYVAEDETTILTAANSLSSADVDFIKTYGAGFQLTEAELANDTFVLMLTESLAYNKPYADFEDVKAFAKEASKVCAKVNSQTWDTLADFVLANEDILIGSNDISDFKDLSVTNRNKVCYSIKPLSFTSLKNLYNKLTAATDAYFESLEDAKKDSKPSSGKGGGGGFSMGSTPVVITPPTTVTPVTPVTPAPSADAFDDLADFAWASQSIANLLDKGIVSQAADSKFRPADRITRAEFVKLVVSALYDVAEVADGDFADVSKDEWCYNYIAIAAKHGLVNGREDGTFGKNDFITRQEMAAVIHRALLDCNLEIAAGTTEYTYGDDAAIADYAKDAVYALYHTGIMSGMAEGSFAPADNANRAQAACVIDRILKGAHNE